MSKIFLGTVVAEPMIDKSASRVVLALTLEELDRSIHCPDGIDCGE